MSVLLRLALAVGIALLAGGASVTPHQTLAGWTHEGLDHPPSAVHATLLEHVRWILAQDEAAATVDRASLANAPAALALGSLTLALLFFGPSRPWRPARLGVAWPIALFADEQRVLTAPQAPPRSSFSS